METESLANSTPVNGQAGANGDSFVATAAGSAANGQVNLVDDDNFVEEVLDIGAPVLVDFMATWCGPCKFMGPVFAQLAPEYEGRVRFAKLDVDEAPGVASALQVQSIPTFMLFKGRAVYAAGIGAMAPNDLRQWIDDGLQRIEEHQHDHEGDEHHHHHHDGDEHHHHDDEQHQHGAEATAAAEQ